MENKDHDLLNDEEAYDLAVLEGWKTLWEGDGRTVTKDELINRGHEIISGEILKKWINVERVNVFLLERGYKPLKQLSE